MNPERLKVWQQKERFIVEVAKELAALVQTDLHSHNIRFSITAGQSPTVILEILGGDPETVEAVLNKYR
jgi:hypothetical protein